MTISDKEKMRFDFGSNWADFIDKNFSEERIKISQRHFLKFLKLNDLNGKIFLDIGCGSGLHSLAAWRAGAERIISFDYDQTAVETTKKLHVFSGCPENWQILQGSVLDARFMKSLPCVDIVYSWGVLHHTGNMWQAIENAALCLHDKSIFYIALYSKDVYVDPPAEYWLAVKRQYNLANSLLKTWMVLSYAWNQTIKPALEKGKNPFEYIMNYKKSRGMSYWHDVHDWLGGYPMDFAGNMEMILFAKQRLYLDLINIKAGDGNTEYLFRKCDKNYWDAVLDDYILIGIQGPFEPINGYAWRVNLTASIDEVGDPARLMLYENDQPVGWPNAPESAIKRWGKGRYRVEGSILIFSTTDNSDPNLTDKSYGFRANFI